MRVRDVEIALVLAREMKDAAARDVDASLRLEQLKEVFGAEELDAGERARIQTALQMAGLEPQPSLLEADPAAPIRFSVAGGEVEPAPVAAALSEAPASEERQEFPTVGEFFGRFWRKRKEPEAVEETETETETELDEPAVEPEHVSNGHVEVEVETNGHAHLDLDDVALPPHDTATPADFGASAETIDFDDPRVEEELLYEAEHDEEEPELEPEWALHPEPEPEPEPEPVAAVPQGARVEEIAALMLPLVAIPVLIASLAGWSFGLPFVALALIATGVLTGRRAGFLSTLRASAAARTILKATVLVTAASIAIAIVLANVNTNSGGPSKKSSAPAPKPKTAPAPKANAPAPAKPTPTPKAATPRPKHHKTATTPSAPPPDNSTKGLIRVPPPSSSQTQTQTTPAPQQQTP